MFARTRREFTDLVYCLVAVLLTAGQECTRGEDP